MGYEKLRVYDLSYKAAVSIYRLTATFPKEEMYGITSQIRRAALSIPLNVAEGYAKRESQAEFRRYLMMALGSSDEVQVLLNFAKDLEYISEEKYTKGIEIYREISRKLNKFQQTTKSEI